MRLFSLFWFGYGLNLALAAPPVSQHQRHGEPVDLTKVDRQSLQKFGTAAALWTSAVTGWLSASKWWEHRRMKRPSEPPWTLLTTPTNGAVNPAELLEYLRVHRTTPAHHRVPASFADKFWVSESGKPNFYTDEALNDFNMCCDLMGMPYRYFDPPYPSDLLWEKMERCVFYALGLIESGEVISGVPLEDLLKQMPSPDNPPGSMSLIHQQPATRSALKINSPTKDDIGRGWNGLTQHLSRQFTSHHAPPPILHSIPRIPVGLR